MDRNKAFMKVLADLFPGFSEPVLAGLQAAHHEIGRGGPFARPDTVLKLWENNEELIRPDIDRIVSIYGSEEDDYAEIEGLSRGWNLSKRYVSAILRMLTAALAERRRLKLMSAKEFQEYYRLHDSAFTEIRANLGENLDFERFFSFPEADATPEYWANITHWTLEEAVALSFGKEPTVVNSATLASDTIQGPSLVKPEYARRKLAMQRALEVAKLAEPIEAGFYIRWCARHGIPLPSNLNRDGSARRDTGERAANVGSGQAGNLSRAEEEISFVNAKSRHSLYKMILIMATRRFGHTFSGNTPASKAIAHAFDFDNRLRMDVGTVRDWLTKIAADPSMEEVVEALKEAGRSH